MATRTIKPPTSKTAPTRVVSSRTSATSSMVISRKVTEAIPRKQLAVTVNAAGRDLAQESSIARMSIPRAIGLAALGGLGGFLAAKALKKSAKLGAGIGAGVGGVGSLGCAMLSGEDQSTVGSSIIVAPTDSAGKGGLTIISVASSAKAQKKVAVETRRATPKTRTVVASRAVKKVRKTFLITKSKHDEPIGWLAAVIAHGGAVQIGMMQYIKEHKNHMLPHLKITPPENLLKSWTRSYSYWTLFTERFMEMPSPMFANLRPPMITYDRPDYTTGTYGIGAFKHQTIWGSANIDAAIGCAAHVATVKALPSSTSKGEYAHHHLACEDEYDFTSHQWAKLADNRRKFEDLGEFAGSIKPAYNIKKWIKYSEEKRRFKNKHLTNDEYKDAVKSYYSRAGISYDAQKVWIPPQPAGIFQRARPGYWNFIHPSIQGIPAYWNQSKNHRQKWMKRLDYFYLNCQWLVWAGEMLRLHSKKEVWKGVTPSRAWRDHCVLWGVGRPTTGQTKDRRNMREYDGGSLEHEAFLLEYTKNDVNKILKAIMYHTPPPCDPRFQGNQIASGNNPRMMMDIPKAAGKLQCPVRMDEWLQEIGKYVGNTAGTSNPIAIGMSIWMSVIGSMAGGAGGVASTITNVGSQVLVTTVSQVMQSIFEFAKKGLLNPGEFSGNDIVGLVGDFAEGALSYMGAEGAGPLFDALAKQGLDIDIDAVMQQVGAGVANAAELETYLRGIVNQYDILSNVSKWDYLDSAFAGLVSDAAAKIALEKV